MRAYRFTADRFARTAATAVRSPGLPDRSGYDQLEPGRPSCDYLAAAEVPAPTAGAAAPVAAAWAGVEAPTAGGAAPVAVAAEGHPSR